jgi:hypothetical protein
MATTGIQTLNRAKYSGLDFDTIFDDLRAEVQLRYGANFNDFALSQLGVMLLDMMAYGLDSLSFYQDRRASDLFLATARTRASVSKLTRQLGYKMGAAVASSVDLTVALVTAQAFDVVVPKGFRFAGPNSLIFETAQATTFFAGYGPADPQTIPCYEGETVTESFVSSGNASQVFELRRVPTSKFVVQGATEVRVNGVLWTEGDFVTFDTTNQYEIGYNDRPPVLVFGDGVAGNIPVQGAAISVKYVASRGKAGQVAKDTITKVSSNLIANFSTIRLTVNNPEGSTGGDDAETLAHAKIYAPLVWKSRQVAVTALDYQALANSYADPLFGRVAAANAVSARSAAGDAEIQSLVATINNAVAVPAPVVAAQTAAISSSLATIATALTDLAAALTDLAVKTTATDADLTSTIASLRVLKNATNEIYTDASDIYTDVTAAQALLLDEGQIATNDSGPSQLTSAMKQALLGYLGLAVGETTAIQTATSSAQSSADAAIATIGSARNTLADIGLDLVTPNTSLVAADTSRQAVETQVPVIQTSSDAISAVVVDTESTVVTATSAVSAHVDAILASDSQANLVSVPILVRDADGFYAPPSNGLIQSLQQYLDARKEVSQSVVVSSGERLLVRAVVHVRVGINQGYSSVVVQGAVAQVVDQILKDRVFGEALYLSELVCPVLKVWGVAFVNITLQGHLALDEVTVLTNKLDSDGNLLISPTEVVTKGTVTVDPPELVVS